MAADSNLYMRTFDLKHRILRLLADSKTGLNTRHDDVCSNGNYQMYQRTNIT